MLKETMNNVFIAGVLVKKDLALKEVDKKDQDGNVIGKEQAISGDLIVRTSDGSEIEVSYFSKKMKKDGSGDNLIFKGLETVMNEYKTLEQFPNEADNIKIGSGQFTVQDYKGKDGEVKTYSGVKGNFANRIEAKDIEKTPLESKFEITGIITKIEDESFKGELSGNKKVTMNVIGYQGAIIPVVTIVPKAIAEPFMSIGFFEGGFAKLIGKLVNTKETVEIVEKMAFGADNVRLVTNTISRKEVIGGNPMGTPPEHEVDETEYNQALAKRKLKLDKIKNEPAKVAKPATTSPVGNPFVQGTATPPITFNPFQPK